MSERMSEERGGERGGPHDRRDISILSDSQRPRSAAPPLCAFLKHPSQCLIISVQYHCWMLTGSPAAAVHGPFKGPQLRITLPNFRGSTWKWREKDFFQIQTGLNQNNKVNLQIKLSSQQ